MKERVNIYYKYSFGAGSYMSGCNLPDPTKGPYLFVRCDMHPAIWDELKEKYSDSVFEDCNM